MVKYDKETLLKYGIEGKTLKQIGEIYGVSRERIRQVFKKYGVHREFYGTGAKHKQRIAETQTPEALQKYKNRWGNKEDSDLYRAQKEKFKRKKTNAKKVGEVWSINFGDILWPISCPILGIELNYFTEGVQENSVSFDQLIPGEGYTKENTVICSWRANRIKNNGTAEEHRLIYEYILNNT